MFPNYPVGDIKVNGRIVENLDINRIVVDHPLTVVNK